MSEAIEHLRRTVLLRDGSGLSDGQLLGCFIEHRDEAAFAGLVRRHGPMVWGVCRRLLSDADAEDAFQATFLVLVRKAASVMPREMIGNWLYGVAHQTALQARRTAARRRARERQVTEMPEPAVAEQDLWRDLQPLLDEELSRLPDKYRAVIVLCDLEGKTRKEAARQLGVPGGTVASRLATARRMLANRLTKRGVTFSGGVLAAVLANHASAGVPTSVVSSTIKAATLFAAGEAAATAAISVKVVALTEGVLITMCFAKLKSVVMLLVVAVLCSATGLIYRTQAADQPRAEQASKKLPANATLPAENERTDNAEGKKTTKEAKADSGKAGESRDVQIRITGPRGMRVLVISAARKDNGLPSIEVPERLNLGQGEIHRLKMINIPNRPSITLFPTVEIPKSNETTEPFVTSSAIPIEFTDEDCDYVRDGNAILKVVYLPREQQEEPTTIASYNLEPGRDVIVEARRRGAILAVVRMGNIDLEADKPVKVEIGDDGSQGRVLRRDKGNAKAEGKDRHADRLEHLRRDVTNMQAENEALRRRLEKVEREIQSLRDLLEGRNRR
jgi:RNA polymerase sigma factor (sigma-70 family)